MYQRKTMIKKRTFPIFYQSYITKIEKAKQGLKYDETSYEFR